MKKIVFMGTPDFAYTILEMLIATNYHIVLVVTKPDLVLNKKKFFSPVKALALDNKIPVITPHNLKEEYREILKYNPDLIITAAYGKIIPKVLLNQVKIINVHGSLLPKYRGGAPIQYTLFNGDQEAGITIMDMVYQMDAGNIIEKRSIRVAESDNYTSLSKKLANCGSQLLKEILPRILSNNYQSSAQDEALVSFSPIIKREDEFLDFFHKSQDIINKIRGLSETPGATSVCNNLIFKIFSAEKTDFDSDLQPGVILKIKKELVVKTADGALKINIIQQQGKKKMAIQDFLNGQNVISLGDQFK